MGLERAVQALLQEDQCAMDLGTYLKLSCCSREVLHAAVRGRRLALCWYFGNRWAARGWTKALRRTRGVLSSLSVLGGEWREATRSAFCVNVRASAPEPYVPEEYALHGEAPMNGRRRVADTALATSKRDGHRAVLVFCGPYRSEMGMSQACYAGCLYEEGLLAARQLRPGHVACQPLGTGRGGLSGRASALALLGALEKHGDSCLDVHR